MTTSWIEKIIGPLEQKKQFRQARARLDALPEPHRTAARACNRYLLASSGVTDGDTVVRMFVDLVDLWERAAVDGTPVAEIVGEDPVEFAESFAQAYGGKRWIDRERTRLVEEIEASKRRESGS